VGWMDVMDGKRRTRKTTERDGGEKVVFWADQIVSKCPLRAVFNSDCQLVMLLERNYLNPYRVARLLKP
jgi:hypothetical protein